MRTQTLIAAPVVAAWIVAAGAAQAADTSCRSDVDCTGNMVCEAGKCVDETTPKTATAGAAGTQAAPFHGRPPNRLAFFYLATPGIGGSKLKFASVGNHFGLDYSPALGEIFRYQLSAGVATYSGATGGRISPLQFGWAVPVWSSDKMGLEVEPIASILDVQVVGGSGGGLFTLSSGASVQANFSYDKLFVALSPLGFDVRYFGAVWNSATGSATGDGALDWRIKVAVGLNL